MFVQFIHKDQEEMMATFMLEQQEITYSKVPYNGDLIKLFLVTEGNFGDWQLIQV